jgi:pimeloyl-ACP methyl ester carboxylesterase
MPKQPVLILTAFCFLLSACAASSLERSAKAFAVAQQAGLQKEMVKAAPFTLTAYARLAVPGKPVHIYIEGDGYAWVTRNRVSGDPTPRQPMALSLAAADPAPNVVYLARPCQYTPQEQNPKCEEFYWTDGRFSEEVVRSIDEAVSYFIGKAHASGADLIGYSGGAAVAVLVAARRTDILSIRTLAGNLDPELVNRYHEVSPLGGSLDPMDVAEKVAAIPQLHFVGGDDTLIPLEAVSSFLKKMGDERCFRMRTVPDASHQDGWTESWPKLLQEPVLCKETTP